MLKWIILFAGIAANASASVLIKVALTPPRRFPSLLHPLEIWQNWPLWLGLGLYGAAFLLYAAALARLPLHVAHPILTAGAIAAVALVSFFFFHEKFYGMTFFGIIFIILGVLMITINIE